MESWISFAGSEAAPATRRPGDVDPHVEIPVEPIERERRRTEERDTGVDQPARLQQSVPAARDLTLPRLHARSSASGYSSFARPTPTSKQRYRARRAPARCGLDTLLGPNHSLLRAQFRCPTERIALVGSR